MTVALFMTEMDWLIRDYQVCRDAWREYIQSNSSAWEKLVDEGGKRTQKRLRLQARIPIAANTPCPVLPEWTARAVSLHEHESDLWCRYNVVADCAQRLNSWIHAYRIGKGEPDHDAALAKVQA